MAHQPIEDVRAQLHSLPSQFGAPDQILKSIDIGIPVPDATIPARIYHPLHEDPSMPALVYFHGGGWSVGTIGLTHILCTKLAARLQCTVVSVEYRLAPEFPFPIPLNDACGAVDWIAHHPELLGHDNVRIAVGGDSAGANLAAVITQLAAAKDPPIPDISYQLLFCPPTDLTSEHDSMITYGQGYFATAEEFRYWIKLYAGEHDRNDPRLSPLKNRDFSSHPPSVIVTAEFDPIRDSGEEYAHRLEAAGVQTKLLRFDGQIHDFVLFGELIPESNDALDLVSDTVRSLISAECTNSF